MSPLSSSNPKVVVVYKQALPRFVPGVDARLPGEGPPPAWAGEAGAGAGAGLTGAEDRCREVVGRELARVGARVEWLERGHLPASLDGADLVIGIGGDGTILELASRVGGQGARGEPGVPVLGVNPYPHKSVGFYCSAHTHTFRELLQKLRSGTLPVNHLPRLAVSIDQVPVRGMYALNDLLIAHPNPCTVSRYYLTVGGVTTGLRSSGVWVSTPSGSTAAIKSAGGEVMALHSPRFQYLVREMIRFSPNPAHEEELGNYPGRGFLDREQPLEVEWALPEGVVYFDGPARTVRLTLGSRVVVSGDGPGLTLLGELGRHRARRAEE